MFPAVHSKIATVLCIAVAMLFGGISTFGQLKPAWANQPCPSGIKQVFEPGQSIRLLIPTKALGATSWKILDYDGAVISEGEITVPKEPITPPFINKAGFYRIVFFDGNHEIGYSGIVIHKDVEMKQRSPHVMIHPTITRFASDEFAKAEANMIRHSYIGSVRTHYFWWLAEPRRGTFTSNVWDRLHRIYEKYDLPIHLVTLGVPSWAAMPGRPDPSFPENLRDIYNFYSWAARQWPKNLWLYEIWNEPDIMGNGTGARTASMTKAVALAVRTVRPDIMLTTPSPASSSFKNWYMEMMTGNDVEDYVDYFACHLHTTDIVKKNARQGKLGNDISGDIEDTYDPERNESGLKIKDSYESFREHYRNYAEAAGKLPAINTESGFGLQNCPDKSNWRGEQIQAEAVPVLMAINQNFGFQRSCYYVLGAWGAWFWDLLTPSSINMGDRSPRAGWYSLDKFAELYGNGSPLGLLSTGSPANRVLGFQVNSPTYGSKLLLVYWNQFGQQQPLPQSINQKSAIFLDHMGNQISWEQGKNITWPAKYALLPPESIKRLQFRNERLFAEKQSAIRKTNNPVILDLLVPHTRYTVRPISGIKLESEREMWKMRVHNFSNTPQQIKFKTRSNQGNLTVTPSRIALDAQQDKVVEVTFFCNPGAMFTTANYERGPFLQQIIAEMDQAQSRLAFNVYPDSARLPAGRHVNIGLSEIGNWYQRKWDTGNVSFQRIPDGMQISSNFSSSQQNANNKVVYVRYKLVTALPSDIPQYDVVVFDLEVKTGSGTFSFVIGNGRDVMPFKFGSYGGGDKLSVTVPIKMICPTGFKWSEVNEINFGICQISSPQLQFEVSRLRLVKWSNSDPLKMTAAAELIKDVAK